MVGLIILDLLSGDHFMTRNPAHYIYKKSTTSQYSNNYSVKIQPAFCSQTLGGHSFGISDTDCISKIKFSIKEKILKRYEFKCNMHVYL